MSALAIARVSKTLGGSLALDAVDLEVAVGSRAAIVGASGSGKTTLLRLIAGFDRPDAGSITIGDTIVCGGTRFAAAHSRGVGFVAQDGALFPHLTTERNIGFGLSRSARRGARVREVAELVGLSATLLSRYPHELSGGQQQRVALARALAPRPSVVLLDEPFSALDTGLRTSTRTAVIEALEASAVTTILVTHDQHEALSFGDQIAVISRGRIVQAGSPGEVFAAPADRQTAHFLGDAIFLPVRVEGGVVLSPVGELRAGSPSGANAASTSALVRPGQISIATGGATGAAGNAVVRSAKRVGSSLEVVALLTQWPEPAEVELSWPVAGTDELASGDVVTLRVAGDVVLYD